MIKLVLGIAVILVIAILLLIFRIQTLITVMKGPSDQKGGLSNRINALMLLVFFLIGMVAFFWYSSIASANFLPHSSSEHGVRTDRMFWITMAILIFAFIVTNIFLFVFSYRYQYKEGNKAYFYSENHKLEIIWTVIPAIVMASLVFYGWKEWSSITQKEPAGSEVIEIMAKQFAWQVRYPGDDGKLGRYNFKLMDATNEFGMDFNDSSNYDDFVPSELHIPKGKPVLLRIRSRDVIHSVFLPHFRIKMDAVPGMPTKFWFVPTKTTEEMRDQLGNPAFNYELACTEICGKGHFAMRMIVVVDELEDYEKWKKGQKTWVANNLDYVTPLTPVNMKGLLPATDKKDTANVAPQAPLATPAAADSAVKSENKMHALLTK